MARVMAHLWLAVILVLGQFAPLHGAIASAPTVPTPDSMALSCCGESCCCGDAGVCPCEIGPGPAPADDGRPAAPAPTRDAEHWGAVLRAGHLTLAHPALDGGESPRPTPERSPRRDFSVSVQSLHSVWLI